MADMAFRCIQEMDIDNRNVEEYDVSWIAKPKLRLRIEDPPRRKHMVYLGGSVLAGIMKDAPEFWINRQDYLEEGCLVSGNVAMCDLCNAQKYSSFQGPVSNDCSYSSYL
ncbi:Actin-related protein 2 [Platanthera zijinensis]|uniref:Actin-related protein 2 n=1 Tax=Platanthera zijinensis TaxID=2320716 RepID=A0AAP0G9D0_9ASPA